MSIQTETSHNVTDTAIYCRVSSRAQTIRGDGLNSQETRCRQYAEFKGYNVKCVFTDDLTGQTAHRPGFQAMLTYLRANRKNGTKVVADDLSRIARSVRVHIELRQAIIDAGGILETPTMELRDDADSELQEYLLATVSQHQSRKNREQTLNRMKARSQNGYWVFQPPIGFKYEKRDGHGKLLVRNEPIASIVQEALEGYASGHLDTQAEVKRFFESCPDFPKDLPDGQIRNQRVNDILNRVTYAGYLEVPKWQVSLREGKHKGIISLETYQRIQDRLKGGARVPARADINADFPLRGFVLCGDCNKPLTACWSKSSTGKRHPYYLCHNRACESHRKSIKRDVVETAFEALLCKLQPTATLVKVVQAMFKKAWEVRLQQSQVIIKSLESKTSEIERQIEQLVDRIVDTTSPSTIAAYERRIEKLEREKLIAVEKLRSDTGPKRTYEEMFELALAFLATPWKLWASDRLEDKRTVLKLAFSERLAYDRKTGLRTPQVSEPFRFLGNFDQKCEMVHPARFERTTSAFGGLCGTLKFKRFQYVSIARRRCKSLCVAPDCAKIVPNFPWDKKVIGRRAVTA